ncbi:MAG: phage tail sheath family protein [Novosphingobium sp.]
MPEYLSPGVYIEEIASGPRPIQGVSTSTAGFAGLTERGPTQPKMVTSWGDYLRWFGDTLDPAVAVMPHAVRGFFENGGRRAFIARVVSLDGGTPATASVIDLPLQDALGAVVPNSVLRLTAQGAGVWGDNIVVRVRRATRANPAAVPPRDWVRVSLYYFRDGAPARFVDPEDPRNSTNPLRANPTVVEHYDNLSFGAGDSDNVMNVLNTSSKLVHAVFVDPGTNLPVAAARVSDTMTTNALTQQSGTLATTDVAVSLVLTSINPPANPLDATISAGTNANTYKLEISVSGAVTETFDNIADANPGDLLAAVNGVSVLVTAAFQGGNPKRPIDIANAPIATPVGPQAPTSTALSGGRDGAAIVPADYAGNAAAPPDLRTGLAGLEIIDEINLLLAPDEAGESTGAITDALIDQCERLRERFAIVATPARSGTVQSIQPPRDSSYGAVYYPWIRVPDRLNGTILIPPSGHVAGIYARTDIERGVHKAPANEVVRGMITRDINAVRKPLEFQIGRSEQDILNPRGVNVIRDFRADGRSIRVWGARTMASDPLWRYINVRRLFLFVEESIDEGTQWVVFEPNYEPTWARVRQSVSNFLLQVWRSGALRGITQDEAFFVRCDRTTMTEADIDAGMLICEVGIAPVKPAEFVIFRIQQKTLEETA